MMQRPLTVPLVFATLAALALGNFAFAVARPRAAEDLSFDHISFSVSEPAKAAAWYVKNLGATPDGTAGAAFGSIRFRFRQAAAAGPSAGSVIDHLGFGFTSLASKVEEWRAAGLTPIATPQNAGGLQATWFQDPWGVRLELLQDERPGLHHVHLLATDRAATLNWLTNSLGGTRRSGSGLEMLRFGALSIAVLEVSQPPVGSASSVIDHLGWTTASVDDAAALLKRSGVKFTIEPRTTGNLRMAFIEGPNQLRVEVLQR
jgi:catechol 2,3-dioxygenase-like lactoylglutathione lyase family enzyme